MSVIVYQFQTVKFIQMMSLTFGLFTQVSGSGPLGPLVCYFGFSYISRLLPDALVCLVFRDGGVEIARWVGDDACVPQLERWRFLSFLNLQVSVCKPHLMMHPAIHSSCESRDASVSVVWRPRPVRHMFSFKFLEFSDTENSAQKHASVALNSVYLRFCFQLG